MADDEISPQFRDRIESRYGGATWKIFVCAEFDGKDCEPSLRADGIRHRCGAAAPTILFVEAEPKREKR